MLQNRYTLPLSETNSTINTQRTPQPASTDTYSARFTADPLTVAENGPPKCPTTDNCIMKVW